MQCGFRSEQKRTKHIQRRANKGIIQQLTMCSGNTVSYTRMYTTHTKRRQQMLLQSENDGNIADGKFNSKRMKEK